MTNGFAGFTFTGADAQTHYGWVRLNITPYTSGYQITVRDFAYESQPNTAILTGAGIAVPEPTAACALGVLALGAVGVRPRRKSA